MSHQCTISFREDRVVFWNRSIEIWLRFLLLHYRGLGDSPTDTRLLRELLRLSYHSDCSGCDFSYLDENSTSMDYLLQAAASLEWALSNKAKNIPKDALNLMNFSAVSYLKDQDIAPVLKAGDEFVSLFTKNQDIIERIYKQEKEQWQNSGGRKCKQCGVGMLGDICFDCGLDWSAGGEPEKIDPLPPYCPIETYADGGNPFDRRGHLKRMEPETTDTSDSIVGS